MQMKPKQSRAEKRHRYSIRKFNQGVASVTIGAFLFLGATTANAEEVTDVTLDTVALTSEESGEYLENPSENTFTESLEQSKVAEIESLESLFIEPDTEESFTILKSETSVTRFVDEAGNTIATEQAGTVNPISIPGYVAVSTATRTSGDTVETIHTYHQLMTYWVDQDGQNLRQPVVGTLPDDDANDLSGYILTNIRTSGGDTYNVYRPATTDDVTSTVTRFIDEAGNTISAEQMGTVDPLSISGYQHIRTREQTGINGSLATTYIYHQIITKYVDDKGASIQADKVGSYPQDAVSGYVLTSYSTGENGDVTNVYRKETEDDKVVVENITKFIDESGNTIATEQAGQVDPIAIDGYFAIRTNTRSKGETVETIHTYHRIVTTWVDEAGKELKASAFGYYPDDEGDDIAGYSLVSSETLKNSDVINTYRVTPEKLKFTIENETRFVDEAGQPLVASRPGTLVPIEIADYFAISSSNRSQTIGEETRVETTHVYHQIVTKYVDEKGTSIQSDKVGSHPQDSVSGYALVSYSVAENADVTNVYRKETEDDKIVVENVTHFVDEKGNTIAPDQTGKVSAIAIDGYFNLSTSTKTKGEAVETTHVYHQIVTKYVDEKGAIIQSDKVGSYPQDPVSGYVLVSYSVAENADVTNVYRKETEDDKVVVENVTHFVDEKGNTIAPDQAGKVSAIAIDGYFNLSTSTKTKGEAVETTHVYHQIVTKYVDEKGASIQSDKIGSHPQDSVSGYVLVSYSVAENADVTNVYRKETEDDKVVVENVTHFVDEKGNTISADQTGKVSVIAIAGYFNVSTSTKTKGEVVETTHVYHQIVTKYVDEKGASIQSDKIGSYPQEPVSGYVLTSYSTGENGDVTNVYRKETEDDKVVVENVTHFVDEKGNTIAPDQIGKVSAIAIDGYFNLSTSTKTKGEVVETTHVYHQIVTKYVDEKGVSIQSDKIGSYPQDPVSGYVLVSYSVAENADVTNVYRKETEDDKVVVENVTHFVDEKGNTIAPDQTGKVSAIDVAGYFNVSTSTKTKGEAVETIHVYHQIVTKYVDEKGVSIQSDKIGSYPQDLVSGYVLVSYSVAENADVTNVYRKETEDDKVVVENVTHFVDEKGNTISPDQTGKVSAIAISGYFNVSTSTKTKGEAVETTHVYHQIVTKYVDDKGASIQSDKVGSHPQDSVSGYVLVSYSVAENGDVTNVYRKETEDDKVVVENVTHFVDEKGNTIAPDKTGKVSAIDVAGYFNVSTSTKTKGEVVETTHVYHQIVTKYIDEKGASIQSDKVGSHPQEPVSGYVLVSYSVAENGDVTNVYRKETEDDKIVVENVTHFVDEKGNTIAPDQTGTVEALAIDGYIHLASSTITKDGRIETVHTYRLATVDEMVNSVTHFVDEAGKSLVEDAEGTVDPKNISGYNHISTTSKTDSQGKVETTHIYRKSISSDVETVTSMTYFITEDGTVVSEAEKGQVNAPRVIRTVEGDLYRHISTAEKTDGNGNTETTHYYSLVTSEELVANETRFVDESGQAIAPSQTGTVGELSLDGYRYLSTSSKTDIVGNVETIHTYRKVLVTKLDESGKELVTDANGNVPGYYVIDTKTSENGDITQTYKPIEKVVKTNDGTIITSVKGSSELVVPEGYQVVSQNQDSNGNVTIVVEAVNKTENQPGETSPSEGNPNDSTGANPSTSKPSEEATPAPTDGKSESSTPTPEPSSETKPDTSTPSEGLTPAPTDDKSETPVPTPAPSTPSEDATNDSTDSNSENHSSETNDGNTGAETPSEPSKEGQETSSDEKSEVSEEEKEAVSEMSTNGDVTTTPSNSSENVVEVKAEAKLSASSTQTKSDKQLPETGDTDQMAAVGLGLANLLGAATLIQRRKRS